MQPLRDGGRVPGAEAAARLARPDLKPLGFTVLTCLNNPDGTRRDCLVETEHPHGVGFGEAALRATRTARLGSTATPDEPLPIRHLTFRVNFAVEGYDPRRRRELPTGSRLPLASPNG